MRAPMTLDIFSSAFLFVCYYTGSFCNEGERERGIGERQKNLHLRKLSRKIWFSNNMKDRKNDTENDTHDDENTAKDHHHLKEARARGVVPWTFETIVMPGMAGWLARKWNMTPRKRLLSSNLAQDELVTLNSPTGD
jgi:hypothetical protein